MNPLPQLPPELILDARTGSADAWAQIFHAFSPVVLGWCRYQGGASIDPEETAHEVFIRLHQRFDRLDDPQHFRSFLYGITRRVVAEARRRQWLRRWVPGDAPVRRDPRPDPEHSCALQQTTEHIERLLKQVPGRFREVLIHCDVEGRAALEVAELLNLPANTVRSRLSRGRARFRAAARREGLTLSQTLMEDAHVG